MKKGQHKTGAVIIDLDNELKLLDYFAPELCSLIRENEDTYYIFHKNIEHSDVPTYGKGTEKGKKIDHLLYYYTENEMQGMENLSFAKQSNISIDVKFFDLMEIERPRNKSYNFSEKGIKVYINNKSLKYFTPEYTEKVFKNLNKSFSSTRRKGYWDFEKLVFPKSEGDFTEVELHVVKLGVATEEDKTFDILRHHLFVGDHIIFLYKKNDKKLYVSLYKNPKFFTVIGNINELYENYLNNAQNKVIIEANARKIKYDEENLSDDKLREKFQKIWRNFLIDEVRSLPSYSDRLVCAFTGIRGDYPQVSPLFRASHIKALKDKNTEYYEKFDINNGLLLCANADALFDKHLITINEDKTLKFSFLIKDIDLLRDLKLLNPITESLLNDKRMEYLKYHRKEFERLEKLRKKPGYDFSNEEEDDDD